MKSLFKCVALMVLFIFSSQDMSAQGFFKKLGKAVNQVTSVVAPTETAEAESTAQDAPDTKAFLDSVPNYTVQKYIVKDEAGNALTNEDGTVQTRYFLVDRYGNVCAKNTAKKHLVQAWKSAGLILLKAGAGAATGTGIGKGIAGGKKGAIIGSVVGAGVGLLAATDDIKEVRKQRALMKECKKVIAAYEKTFTEEGTMLDATADLSDIDGIDFTECAELDKNAEEIKAELQASIEQGGSLDDINLDDLDDIDDIDDEKA